MKISMIGCGRTCRAIAGNLAGSDKIEKIFLYDKDPQKAADTANILNSSKAESIGHIGQERDVDYSIITLCAMDANSRIKSLTERENTDQVRKDELRFNVGNIYSLKKDLSTLEDKARIIVVTNPVDQITNYVQAMLPQRDVYGFGLELDVIRYSTAMGKKVSCIGSHGTAVPLINSDVEEEYSKAHKITDSILLNSLRKDGIPYELTGKIFKEFFEKLNSDNIETVHMSGRINKEFMGIKNISVSLPFYVRKGEIVDIADFYLNNIERKLFLEDMTQLKESINDIEKYNRSVNKNKQQNI